MPKVNTSLNIVERALVTPMRWISNSKTMQKIADKASKSDNFEKVLAATTIGSIVLKDGISCGMYVYQSAHNEKIPKEKRSFVAALDLTNGGLMILAQLGFFFLFKKMKVAENLFDKVFKKFFSPESIKSIETAIRARAQKVPLSEKTSRKNIEKSIENYAKTSKKLFASLIDLAAAAILAKRVVVPFLATPLASIAREKIFDKNGEHKNTDTSSSKNKNSITDDEARKIIAIPESPKKQEPEFKGNILEHYIETHK